jgi:drug/metabolite transporter (DMT)-like permease
LVWAWATGDAHLPPRRAGGLAALTGMTGSAGTVLYFYATQAGLLAVTAVLTSLYPAVTIVLARMFAGERLTAVRLTGLCLAAASVGLIAAAGPGNQAGRPQARRVRSGGASGILRGEQEP